MLYVLGVEIFLIGFIVVAVLMTFGGIKLVQLSLARVEAPEEPPIPVARTANVDAKERARRTAERIVTRTPRKIGRSVRFAAGVWLITAPWLGAYWLYSWLTTSVLF